MKPLAKRLQTFAGWPSDHPIAAELLAYAGFVWTGDTDAVHCEECTTTLSDWYAGNDPWVAHAMTYPPCDFVKQKKGTKFIKQYQHLETEDACYGYSITEMRTFCAAAGLKFKYPDLVKGCTTYSDRINKMFALLRDAGLKGKPNLSKCMALKTKLDETQKKGESCQNRQREKKRKQRGKCIKQSGQKGKKIQREKEQSDEEIGQSDEEIAQSDEEIAQSDEEIEKSDEETERSEQESEQSEPTPRPGGSQHPGTMKSFDERIKTYAEWPPEYPVAPQLLAEAGFVWTGEKDKVHCENCDLYLIEWEEGDDPWERHSRYFPRCSFVENIKGAAFMKKHWSNWRRGDWTGRISIPDMKIFCKIAGLEFDYEELVKDCRTYQDHVDKMLYLLEAAGLDGKPTIEKCKDISRWRKRYQQWEQQRMLTEQLRQQRREQRQINKEQILREDEQRRQEKYQHRQEKDQSERVKKQKEQTKQRSGQERKQSGREKEQNGKENGKKEARAEQSRQEGERSGQESGQSMQEGERSGQESRQSMQEGERSGQDGERSGQEKEQNEKKRRQSEQEGDRTGRKRKRSGQEGKQSGREKEPSGKENGKKEARAGQSGQESGQSRQQGERSGEEIGQSGLEGERSGQDGERSGQEKEQNENKRRRSGQERERSGQKRQHSGEESEQSEQESDQESEQIERESEAEKRTEVQAKKSCPGPKLSCFRTRSRNVVLREIVKFARRCEKPADKELALTLLANLDVDKPQKRQSGQTVTVPAKKPKIPCKECGKPFSSVSSLTKHRKTCGKSEAAPQYESFNCRLCDKRYSSLTFLQKHVTGQHGNMEQDNNMSCEKCGEIFEDQSSLAKHRKACVKSSSSAKDISRFTCKHCNTHYSSEAFLKKHIEDRHKGRNVNRNLDVDSRKCETCGEVFTFEVNLEEHKKTCGNDDGPDNTQSLGNLTRASRTGAELVTAQLWCPEYGYRDAERSASGNNSANDQAQDIQCGENNRGREAEINTSKTDSVQEPTLDIQRDENKERLDADIHLRRTDSAQKQTQDIQRNENNGCPETEINTIRTDSTQEQAENIQREENKECRDAELHLRRADSASSAQEEKQDTQRDENNGCDADTNKSKTDSAQEQSQDTQRLIKQDGFTMIKAAKMNQKLERIISKLAKR